MNTPDRFLLRWLRPMLFGAWSAGLLYLLITGRYTLFLRPAFGWLLILAHFIAMGFMIAALPGERPTNVDIGSVLRAAVLLVPIFYLLSLPADTLGSREFTNRFVGSAGMRASEPAKAKPPARRASSISNSDRELTILDLMLNPERYDGQQVVLTGMMLHDEELKKYFGGRDTAVYRFLINCCAADALPLAVAVESDQAKDVATDQWVRVEGVFHLRRIGDDAIPVVEDAGVNAVDTPDGPYLY
jgi:putative membrane protein